MSMTAKVLLDEARSRIRAVSAEDAHADSTALILAFDTH